MFRHIQIKFHAYCYRPAVFALLESEGKESPITLFGFEIFLELLRVNYERLEKGLSFGEDITVCE